MERLSVRAGNPFNLRFLICIIVASKFENCASFSSSKPPGRLLTMTDVRKGQKTSFQATRMAVLEKENQELNDVLKTRVINFWNKSIHVCLLLLKFSKNSSQVPLEAT